MMRAFNFQKTLAGVVTAIALSASLSAFAADEIKIGVPGPFTGPTAVFGLSARNGMELAVEEINAAGGVLGKKLVLLSRDDEAKNERGAQIVREMVEKDGVVALIGPINTGVIEATTGYSISKKVPQIISSSSGGKVNGYFAEFPKGNYIFRYSASDEIISKVIVNEAATKSGFKKPAIITDDTNFGQMGKGHLESHLAKLNIKPVYVGKFKLKDTDMTAQIQQAKAADADVVLVYGLGPELAAISNSMEKVGWKVPMIGTWTLSMPNYVNNAGKNGEGTRMPLTFIESEENHPDNVKKFLEKYYAKFNEKPIKSPISAIQSYDAVYLLKAAIEQAKSTDGTKIKDALENLNKPFNGLTGNFKKPFSSTDHEALKDDVFKIGVVNNKVIRKHR